MTSEETDLAALAATKEVKIETRSATGEAHRTIIWIVEQGGDVYVRSVNGPTARWYREALAEPAVVIHANGRSVPATAVPAQDDASVEACSEALRAKYRRSSSLPLMLVPHALPTTLRLVPA